MGGVLGLTSEPSAVRGSDRPPPCLQQGEKADIEVGRVRDPLRKGLLHVGLDSIRGLLLQTPMALLVIEEQVSSTRAIYLHMFQLPKLLSTCTTIPAFQENAGGRGRPGQSAIITSNIRAYSSMEVFPVSALTSANVSDSPCRENHRVSSKDMYSPWSSGEYISPESLHLSGSITVVQQLTIVTRKYNLQAPRLLTLHAADNSTWRGTVAK